MPIRREAHITRKPGTYTSDLIFEGLRVKDAEEARQHMERVARAKQRRDQTPLSQSEKGS